MSTDVRVLLSILFSLVILVVGCGCGGISLGGETIRPTKTPTTQSTSTPAPTPIPTPIGWPATAEAVLFGDDPCAPPCWQGITSGVSTEEDVARILEQLKTAGVVKDYDRPSLGGVTYWVYLVGVDKVTIRLEDDRVEFIKVSNLRIGYRAERAIERFGEPEAVVPYYRMNDQFSCEQWDDSIATIVLPSPSWLLYPSQGVTLVLDTPAPGVICPQMFISRFLYYQPRSLTEALDEGRGPVFGFNITGQEDLVEWHGYGQGY